MCDPKDRNSSHCKHYVVRKKRYCKMTVKLGEEYCGEHQGVSVGLESNSTNIPNVDQFSKIRIVCPLDSKHTCYAHNLKKHLKICNAGRISTEPYILKGINSGKESAEIDDCYKLLSTFSISDIKNVILKVNEIYENLLLIVHWTTTEWSNEKYAFLWPTNRETQKHSILFEGDIRDKISEKILHHILVEEEMAKPDYGEKTKKHLKQVSAILGLLNEYKLLMKPGTCYVEFGAGRGQLSYWIANSVKNVEGSTVLLVERASPKHKRDNKLDKSFYKIQRVRADICDLLLDKVEVIASSTNVVGVTKHLCGEATDLAIRCLANLDASKHKLGGAVLTFCCHHRCRWTPYVGREYFEENKLSENEFYIMCGMASWATCGTGVSREKRKNDQDTMEIAQNQRDIEIGLSREEKEIVGLRSKHILNWGRLLYLEKLGFNCVLHFYVEKSISLENICIVAFR